MNPASANAAEDRYEGLNLPQLFELMHDIVVPDPVSRLPQTDAWWLVLAWAVAVLALCAAKYIRHRERNRYRREALAELDRIEAAGNVAGSAAAIAVVLKRTALSAWPRERVAALCGTEWARFLTESAPDDEQVAQAAPRLAAAAYQPDADPRQLLEPARRWITVHRA